MFDQNNLFAIRPQVIEVEFVEVIAEVWKRVFRTTGIQWPRSFFTER
jgi:hypothetical protein